MCEKAWAEPWRWETGTPESLLYPRPHVQTLLHQPESPIIWLAYGKPRSKLTRQRECFLKGGQTWNVTNLLSITFKWSNQICSC